MALGAIAIVAACGDDDATGQPCTAGAQVTCACLGGGSGVQRCSSDGSGYEACQCGPGGNGDGGAKGDGSTLVPADAGDDGAPLEPTGPVQLGTVDANGGGSVGMIVDGNSVFVAVTKLGGTPDGKVVSIPITGGQAAPIATGPLTGQTFQTGNLLAVSATDVYYVTVNVGAGDTIDIMKKARDGSGSATPLLQNVGSLSSLQYADNFIYWRAGQALRRSPITNPSDMSVLNTVSADFLVVGANVYYGSNGGTVSIERAPVAGGGSSTIVADAKCTLLSLTADPAGTTFVYHDFSPNSTIYRAPLAGAPSGTLVTAMTNDGTETPRIATDGTKVYYVSNFLLKAVPIGGGASVDLVTNQKPLWVTNFGKHIYWYNRTDNTVWRMLK